MAKAIKRGVGLRGCMLVVGVYLGAQASAQGLDPFVAGTRWARAASVGAAWMPEQVHFAGRDQFVWCQAGGNVPHQALMRSDSDSPLVDRQESLLSSAAQVRRSAAGAREDRVYALLQTDAGSAGLRDTEVLGYAPFSTARGSEMLPLWIHSMGALSQGDPLLCTDGSGDTVVAALWLSGQNAVQVDVLDGTTGGLLTRSFWPGLALNAAAVSKDGSRLAIAAGLDLYILDGQGQILHHETMSSTLSDLALSADGSRVAASGMAGTRLFEADSGGYSQTAWIPAHTQTTKAQQTISVKVGLSDDGQTLAVAQWSFAGNQETAFEIWNMETGARLFRTVQPGSLSGFQNLPTAARITPDGQRAAFAAWGNGVDPEVLLVDRDSSSVVQAFDLPGSAFSIDLDATGTRIAAAYKQSHAQVFHSHGAFALLDSGERELQALSAARPGHSLRVAAAHPGAGIVILLLGQPGPQAQVPGVTGRLLLDRSRVAVRAALADPSGAAQFLIDVPPGWTAAELPFAIQAAFRLPNGTAVTDGILQPLCLN